MRLATLRDGTPDGALVVIGRSGEHFVRAGGVARTLQAALDDWENARPALERLAGALDDGKLRGEPVDTRALTAPLPRAYEWVDGSAYLSHIALVRKARGAELPKTLRTEPLVYQGGSGVLLGPRDPLVLSNPDWGLDFEGEVAVVLGATPQGTRSEDAAPYIRLVLLANDVTYRGLVPAELEKGFGFFVSKPATAFSPFAVTPDELGGAFREGRLHLRLRTLLNGALVGDPDAGAPMHFSFHDLVQHITKTRSFCAGTILGSGTVSNEDPARGVSCLVERRTRETLDFGGPKTPYLQAGDRVRIEMLDAGGRNVFGSIEQEVVAP
ncbi:MAG TPA: fumarylacetoacetate hydrolase family protein [Polyangiaceae bacterium]|nr:fumarylacetoacetate hydrolase family protein [Polyangiaceae bacterium]